MGRSTWTAEQQAAVAAQRRALGLCVKCGKEDKHPLSVSLGRACILRTRAQQRIAKGYHPEENRKSGRKPLDMTEEIG